MPDDRSIRRLTSEDITERLSDLFIDRGPPEHIRSDNGPEFIDRRVLQREVTRPVSQHETV